jgi:DNA-binding XRE family transcriptional regulator
LEDPLVSYRPKEFDVRALRRRMNMTQKQFCRRFGFCLATLRHWERGDRKPNGTALILLNVVRHNPRAVVAAVLNTYGRERRGMDPWTSPVPPAIGRPRREVPARRDRSLERWEKW